MSDPFKVSAAFKAACRDHHTTYSTVDLYVGDTIKVADVPIDAGSSSVKVDRTAFARREANLVVAKDQFAAADRALLRDLSQPGATLRVRTGFRYATGATETVPVHTGKIAYIKRDTDTGTIQIRCPDQGKAVADNAFTQPRVSTKGVSYVAQIKQLITETDPDAYFRVSVDAGFGSMLEVVWEQSRADPIAQLAVIGGMEVFASPAPHLWIIRPIATAQSLPKHVFARGETLVSVAEETDWSDVFNGWTVRGERADAAAVSAFVFDNDPASPTYYYGPFGQRNQTWTSSLLSTQAACATAGAALLASSYGARSKLSWVSLRDPLLDGGDPCLVHTGSESWRMVLDSFTVPLGAGPITDCAAAAQQVLPQ